jgi:hypothetical protein
MKKLAGATRARLTQEFAEKHTNLRERVRRLPISETQPIAEKYHCSLQIAEVAYLINMDGITTIREAIDLLTFELNRRTAVDEDIPNIPGNVQEFALTEGKWIEHNYGSFARVLELKVRELSNLEGAIGKETPTVERAISILSERTKLAETLLLPVIQEWLKDHPKSNPEDVLMAFGPAITKWSINTLKGKFTRLRRNNQAVYRKLREVLATETESAVVDSLVSRIDALVEDMNLPFNSIQPSTAAHFLLHIAPRPSGRGDMTRTVIISAASTRGNKAEPDMTSPFDFLERDVRLARRRKGDERRSYLSERVDRVIRALKYQGNSPKDCVEKSYKELIDRMSLESVPVEDLMDNAEARISEVTIDAQDDVAVNLIIDYVFTYVYGESAS